MAPRSIRRRFRTRTAAAALVTIIGVGAAGCSGGGSSSTDDNKVDPASVPFGTTSGTAVGPLDEATWQLAVEPATLDVDLDNGGTGENTVLANVCDRLMQIQPDLTLKAHIASSAEWTDDNHIVFTLRPDATFHDGTPITADDVVWSLERHAREEAYESDEFENVESIEATGDGEVTLTMTQRDAVFLQAMAANGGIIWDRETVEAAGEDFGSPSAPEACSGPYEVSDWKSGSSLTITKTADYWDTDIKPLTDTIVFTWATESAAVNNLKTGQVDGGYLDGLGSAAALSKVANTKVYLGPSTNAWVIIPTTRGVLADARVRRALSLVLDRQGVADAALNGLAEPWKTPIGEGAWGYERDAFQTAYDALEGSPAKPSEDSIAEAKALIADAGAEGKSLVVASNGGTVWGTIGNALVAAGQSIGLDAKLVTLSEAEYYDFYSDEDVRLTADAWIDEYYISKNDPIGFYKNGASDASVNFSGFASPEYDQLVKNGQAATDEAARSEIAIQLQEMWNDEMVYISVTNSPISLAMKDTVTGPTPSAAFLYYPWAAQLGSAK
jgi:peptide/nickel transport system substrate-binding protein